LEEFRKDFGWIPEAEKEAIERGHYGFLK